MALKEQLQKLATEKNAPCVTISMNTHRTYPDNALDEIMLKNLLKEAEERVINDYGKRPAAQLLDKIESVSKEIDINYNLDSLHIFLSNQTQEIVKSAWKTNENSVHISDSFAIRPLIKKYNRSENYLIMLLSQSGVNLYQALNDEITEEIKNEHFPFTENRHFTTNSEKGSDAKHADDLVREFLNKVDKALVQVYREIDLKCIVVSTEDNYSRLQQVVDIPGIYIGYVSIDYNQIEKHAIAKQAWELVKIEQKQRRTEAISQMHDAVSQGNVLTDLQEIYQAALDGRGDLLIVHHDFVQAVVMKDERTFDLVENAATPNSIEDITSLIAWEVISKKGNVTFTAQDEIKELGKIVLKTRY